jgi:putative copper resistance protein D
LVVGVGAIALYLFGVIRLSRRGDKWPIGRTISWILGMSLLLWVTSGPLNVYEQYLFSTHMLAHMILTMGVPVLLVPGAPVTLLLRSSEARKDDSRGLREWVLWAVHTPWAQLVSHPIFAGLNFAASLVIFYFTPLFSWSLHDHLGHEWMIVHFLITGYLFVQALISIDPGPAKLPYLMRLMLLIGTLTFHAFFGLALMSGNSLLVADWFGSMGRTWGQLPLDDQQTGGAIAWGIGEMPSAVLTIIVSIQWFRNDSREAKRLDRASDRTGNKDVEDYNAMLARLAKRDGERR